MDNTHSKNFSMVRLVPSLLLLTSTTLVSTLYICLIYRLNSRLVWHDKSEFTLHLLISSGTLIGLFWLFSFCVTGAPHRLPALRLIFRFLLPSYLLLLATFYLISLLANYFWGDNITFQLVREYIAEMPLLLDILPLKTLSLYLGLTLFGFFYLGLFAFCLRASKAVLATLETFLLHHRIRGRAVFFGGMLLFAGYGFFVWSLFYSAPRFKFWKEPFMDFYLATNYVAADINPRRMKVVQQDRVSRSRYVGLTENKQRPNIVLIVVDSLRADHLPVYGYSRETSPFITKMSEKGLLKKVDMALATCPNTYCGVLSILTSKPYRDISYDNFKLHDLLRLIGYRINFILSGDHISWYNMGTAYGENIDFFFDFRQTTLSNSDDQLIEEALKKLVAYDGTPNFFFFHLMSAHLLGLKHERHKVFNPTTLDQGSLHAVRINRYDNGIYQSDYYIEKILIRLRELGYLSDSIVLITSDHGENLLEDGNLPDHGWNLRQHQIRIPILIYDTGGREYKDLTLGRQVDIAPTIVDRIGLPPPDVWWGTSLLGGKHEKCSYHQSVKGDPSFAVVCRIGASIYKYVVQKSKIFFTTSEQLYDLSNDPQEKQNLVPRHTALLDHFRKLFQRHWQSKEAH